MNNHKKIKTQIFNYIDTFNKGIWFGFSHIPPFLEGGGVNARNKGTGIQESSTFLITVFAFSDYVSKAKNMKLID